MAAKCVVAALTTIVALGAAACSDSTTIEGSRAQLGEAPATEAAPVDEPTVPAAPGRGTRSGAPEAAGDGDEASVASSPEPSDSPDDGAPPASTTFAGNPIADSVAELADRWDRLNREVFESGREGYERVAAESEQFATAAEPGGTATFAASLTENGLLGGSLDEQGRVVAVVAVTRMDSARDAVVAFTTLDLAAADAREVLDAELAEVAAGPPGSQERVETAGGVIVLERIGEVDTRVFIAYAEGAESAALAELGRSVAERLLQAYE